MTLLEQEFDSRGGRRLRRTGMTGMGIGDLIETAKTDERSCERSMELAEVNALTARVAVLSGDLAEFIGP